MLKTTTINQNYLFRRLYRGKALVSPCIAVYWRKTGRPGNRLGITATKKIGGAVQRNRARRVILEAYRLLEPELPSGLDLVIVARKAATQVKMQTVREELRRLMERIRKAPGKDSRPKRKDP